ncbi:MAG TPA: 8-oxo-dGTP diphosphatase [Candidatus Saccharimonadales bacterium]|nr:8-oxo-dGTP diphosphatase [Candidatus Saccharimonadales bacterium]
MKQTTIVFLLKDDQVLLAMKKRGFGAGKWNGVGGKVEPGETVEQAAIRETQEEINVTPRNLEKVAHHTFIVPSFADGTIISHVFVVRDWQGEPTETEEMAPKWFKISEIPYDQMWDDDKHWLPQVLNGEKLVCNFDFDDNDLMIGKDVKVVAATHELLA